MTAPAETDGGGLFERAAELAAIEQAFAAVAEANGSCVAFVGPAGIGKTALIDAAASSAAAHGMLILRARGGELEGEFAFGVVRQLFEGTVRSMASEAGSLFSGPARLAASLLDIEVEGGSTAVSEDPVAPLHGLYWLTVNLAEGHPVAILVDDAHWADQGSLRFLGYLARRLGGLCVALVVAARPVGERSPEAVVQRLAADGGVLLEPKLLSEAAASALIRAEIPDADEAFCRAWYSATGGNPFYLRELLVSALDGSDAPVAERVGARTPEGIIRAVAVRLERLSDETIRLARATAVLGSGAPLRHAASVAGIDPDVAAASLDTLAAAGILKDARPLEFVHPVVREAVHTTLPVGARSAAHARAARLLFEDGAPTERVAAHQLEAEPAGDPWVCESLTEASRGALSRGAPEAAVAYLRRALIEPPATRQRAAMLMELGIAEWRSADPLAAVEHLRAGFSELGAEERHQAALPFASVLAFAQQPVEAVDVIDSLVAEIAPRDPDHAARLDAHAVNFSRMAASARGRVQERVQRLRRRVEDARESDHVILASVAAEMAMAGDDAGRTAAVAERALSALASAPPDPSDWSAYVCVRALVTAERYDLASAALDAALADARARGAALEIAMLSAYRAELLLRLGDLPGAEEDARAGFGICTEQAWPVGLPANGAILVDALVQRGELGEAAAIVAQGLFALPPAEIPEDYTYNMILSSRGRLRLAQDRVPDALDDFVECGRRLEQLGEVSPAMFAWRRGAAVALLRLGDETEAREMAGEELERARVVGAPRVLGAALRTMGLVGTGEARLDLLEEAAKTLEGSPAALERARTLADLGSALRGSGHPVEARNPLREALELAHGCGALPLEERAIEELHSTGARPRRPVTTGAESLTPSERRVADLAAGGQSNREIAQSLFVTVRTIEFHLGGTYRKLGIGSRAELERALASPANAGH